MKAQHIVCSVLCSFALSSATLATEKNNTETSLLDQMAASNDKPMDFPDTDSYAPIEGEKLLPWDQRFGYDDGFFIRNANDTFSLFFNGLVQARYLYSQADGLSDYHRFELRRTELYFTGHFLDESWTYVLGLAAGPDGNVGLDDVYIAKSFNDNVWAQVGQFSTPFLRESLLSSTRQLTIERSLITKYFSTEVSTGAMVGLENDSFKWLISANNGYFEHDKTANDDDQSADTGEHDFINGLTYAFISRLEYKPFGTWEQFRGSSSPEGTPQGFLVGVAGAYQRDRDEANIEEISGTVDATLQGSGWNVFAMAAATRDTLADEETSYGAQLQGGLFVDEMRDKVELFSRYEWGDSGEYDTTEGADDENLSILTAGVNVFLYPSYLKWTTDLGYAFSSVGGNWAQEIDGWRVDETSGQWVARTQLQLTI